MSGNSTSVVEFEFEKQVVAVNIDDLKKELEQLGIESRIIHGKDVKNLYVAKRIVEDYNFGRELRIEEKRGLMEDILDMGVLDTGKRLLYVLLNRLMQNRIRTTRSLWGNNEFGS